MGLSTEDITKRLERIEKRLVAIEKLLKTNQPREKPVRVAPRRDSLTTGVEGLLELPDSLRKSMMAIQELGEATAEETAQNTERTRSVESIYLNQLVRMGLLQRERRGKKVYFRSIEYY